MKAARWTNSMSNFQVTMKDHVTTISAFDPKRVGIVIRFFENILDTRRGNIGQPVHGLFFYFFLLLAHLSFVISRGVDGI